MVLSICYRYCQLLRSHSLLGLVHLIIWNNAQQLEKMAVITRLPSDWSLSIHSTENILRLSIHQVTRMQAQMELLQKFPVILALIRITMVVLSFLWQWGSCQCYTVYLVYQFTWCLSMTNGVMAK